MQSFREGGIKRKGAWRADLGKKNGVRRKEDEQKTEKKKNFPSARGNGGKQKKGVRGRKWGAPRNRLIVEG